MNILSKIFSGIRKVIAFPFTSAGILIMVCGIIVIAAGLGISGNTDKVINYLESVEDEINEEDNEEGNEKVEEKEE